MSGNNNTLDTNNISRNLPTNYDALSQKANYVYFQPDVTQIQDTDTKLCFSQSEYRENNNPPPMMQLPGLHTKESCKMNTGLILANKKWTQNFVPDKNLPTVNQQAVHIKRNVEKKTPGLIFKVCQGYYGDPNRFGVGNSPNDNVNHFKTANVLKTGTTTEFGNITQATSGYIRAPHGDQHYYSVEWTGFFIPNKTGIWRFDLIGDDACYLWIGDNAISGYTITNALIDDGALHGMARRSGSISLVKDKKYPIRMQFGENWGGHDFVFEIYEPSGSRRSDYANLLFQVSVESVDRTDTINSFNLNSNIYYSLTQSQYPGLYNCFVNNDPNAKSEPNNYGYESIWTIAPRTSSGNSNSNPSGYSGTLSFTANIVISGGTISFNLNGNEIKLGRSNGIIYLDDDGIFYIQDTDGNNQAISSDKGSNIEAIENNNWANYKYTNNITNQLDLSKSGDINTPNKAILISNNNKYKLEINEVGLLTVKKTIKGCITKEAKDLNGSAFNYTTNNNSDYYLYTTDVDKKIDKLFLAQNLDTKKTLQYIEKDNTAVSLANNYIKYPAFAPTPDEMTAEKQINGGVNECQTNCNSDPNCKYFYNYTKSSDGKNYCLNKSDGFRPTIFTPIQPNTSIRNSDLYVRDFKMNLNEGDFRNLPAKKNITNYKPYSDTEVNPYTEVTTRFDKNNVDGDLDCSLIKPMATQYLYFNGTNDMDPNMKKIVDRCTVLEGFDNHGYENSNTVYNTYGTGIPQNIGLPAAIIQKQINPMKQIASDYSNKLSQVNKKYVDLSSNIQGITNVEQTGLRDVMSGDSDYDYDTEFTLNKPKTLLDGRVEDSKQLVVQENSVYALGSITAAALIVFAIVLARE
jgi:hypothetical protein